MKREIAIIKHYEILTDKTGEYCFRDDGTRERCSVFGWNTPWCERFDTGINRNKNDKFKRCQACHDAEGLARELKEQP
jgi:hypothetical protein